MTSGSGLAQSTVGAIAMIALFMLTGAAEHSPAKRIPAEEARQGAASDGRYVFAIDNSRIGKYRIADGKRVAHWSGDAAEFPHLNSCVVVKRRLICASSNYPDLPQTSRIEFFDTGSLKHLGSRSLGATDGSLTALTWHDRHWWAIFAQYDGKGGQPGKSSRDSKLVQMDADFRPLANYAFPGAVLDRTVPYSISGASWTHDGRLAVSGHDRPEVYILSLPQIGSSLRLDATLPVAAEGQAIDWDARQKDALWGVSRKSRELVLSDLSYAFAGH
jgi:hypothetical protein